MAETRYSLVAYLEILTPAAEPDQATWAAVSERMRESRLDTADGASSNERRSFQLDNLLVLVQPLDVQHDPRTALGMPVGMLLRLAYLQMHSWGYGVLFRGAVAHGEALIGADVIAGPAVRAARLQARQEHVPRIIVDPELLQPIVRDLRAHGPRHELALLEHHLLAQDSDGLWFLDYLTLPRDAFGDSKRYVAWLEAHARQLEVLARVSAKSEDARLWLWLASYHDRVVANLKDIDEAARDSLRIASDTPLRFQF